MALRTLETRITINMVFLVLLGVTIALGFTWMAFSAKTWAWLVAPPIDAAGIFLVIRGYRQRQATDNERGTGISILGALLIVASVWVAFMLGNALSS